MNIPNKVFWLSHHHYDTFLPLEIKKGKIDFEEEGLLITFYADLLGEIKKLAVPLEPAIEESVFFDRKIKPIDIETSELDKYIGDFKFMENTCKTYIKNDDLYVFISGQPEYKLKPINKDLFSLVVQESFKVKFDINKRGEVSHLSFVQPNGTFKYKKAK
jgi:hypothetical protein